MPSTNRDARFDTLKAVAIIFVLCWHLQPFQVSQGIASWIIQYFYWHISLIAVPLFYIVSLYLFYTHKNLTWKYLGHRLSRIAIVYLFWTTVQFAVYGLTYIKHWSPPLASLSQIINSGGPALKYVGDSVMYFLFDLLFLTVFAFLFNFLNEKIKTVLSISLIAGFLLYFAFLGYTGAKLTYYTLDNFIIYVPIAYLLASKSDRFRWIFVCILLIAALSLGAAFGEDASAYDRPSIVAAAVVLFWIVYIYNLKLTDRVTAFLGFYSLGIFAMHKYFQLFFMVVTGKLFSIFSISTIITVKNAQINIVNPTFAAITVTATIGAVLVLRRTRLKIFVS